LTKDIAKALDPVLVRRVVVGVRYEDPDIVRDGGHIGHGRHRFSLLGRASGYADVFMTSN
jgi:hypothetical protein